MSKKLRFLLIIIPLGLSLTITGCSLQDLLGKNNNKSTAKKSDDKPIIAVSLNEEDPNKLLISKGIDDLAEKEDVKINYIGQSDTESPLKNAKILIYQGGDASLLQKSQAEKIPILALTQLPSGVKPEGIVIPDQEKAGELMAQTLLGKVSEGDVVILQGDPNESGSQSLLAGNNAVLSRYPKMTVHTISSPQGTESVARTNLADFLQKNRDKVKGILAHTDKLAAQASEVLKQAQLDKTVSLVGGQASLSSLQRMAGSTQIGDVDTSPYLQGANAYQWAQKIIQKEPLELNRSITSEQGEIPAKVIEVKAVTPANLSVIQKSYAKTTESAEQAQKEKDKEKEKEQSSQDKKDDSKSNNQEKQGGDEQGSKKEGQKEGSVPPGVEKVTERVKTETTRDYLDAQGKVIGTEKTVNEQVKTVPPDMLNQQKNEGEEKEASSKQSDKGSKEKGGK